MPNISDLKFDMSKAIPLPRTAPASAPIPAPEVSAPVSTPTFDMSRAIAIPAPNPPAPSSPTVADITPKAAQPQTTAAPVTLKMANAVPIGAAAQPAAKPADSPLWQQPGIQKHMAYAWQQAGDGQTPTEGSFIVNKDGVAIPLPMTGDYHKETFSLQPDTQAVFHSHPNGTDAEPSDADKKIADKYKVKMYVMSNQGLSMYDPATKKTTWITQKMDYLPEEQPSAAQTAVQKAMKDAWDAATKHPKSQK